ncbi:MAG: tetratricopeptide repeat protein [Pseudomonadota bacterium]
MTKKRLAAPAAPWLLALLIAAAPLAAGAADSGPPAAADPLAEVRAHLEAERWTAAIEALQRLDARDNADWNNLMGYSMRKRKTPDLAAAERYYDEALRLNPQHRGALEYSGELYLMKGELAKAEARLAVLDKLCFLPCAEYTDLKKAVERYKATGRY